MNKETEKRNKKKDTPPSRKILINQNTLVRLITQDTILDPDYTYRKVKAQFLEATLQKKEMLCKLIEEHQVETKVGTVVGPILLQWPIPLVMLHVLEKIRDLNQCGFATRFFSPVDPKTSGIPEPVKNLLSNMDLPEDISSAEGSLFMYSDQKTRWNSLAPFLGIGNEGERMELKFRFDSLGYAFILGRHDESGNSPILFVTGQNDATWVEQFYKAQSSGKKPIHPVITLYVPSLPVARRHIWCDDSLPEIKNKLEEQIASLPDARAQYEYLDELQAFFINREQRRLKALSNTRDKSSTGNSSTSNRMEQGISLYCDETAEKLKEYLDNLLKLR